MGPDKEKQAEAEMYIATMITHTQLNIDSLDTRVMHMKPCALKDVVIVFVQNQKDWLRKLKKAMASSGLQENAQRDLDAVELIYYGIIIEYARQAIQMEAVAKIMEAVATTDYIPDTIVERLVSILKSGLSQDERYWMTRCAAAENLIHKMSWQMDDEMEQENSVVEATEQWRTATGNLSPEKPITDGQP